MSGRTVVMDGELVAGAGGIGEETEGSEGSAPSPAPTDSSPSNARPCRDKAPAPSPQHLRLAQRPPGKPTPQIVIP